MSNLRDYYLSTLGVVQYVPREYCAIEAAGEPAVSVEPASSAATLPTTGNTAPSIDFGAINPETPASPPRQPARQTDVRPDTDTETPQEVRLRISCWQPCPDLLVAGSLAYGQNPPQDQQQLLAGILQAIGRLPGPLREPELLDWPSRPGADASVGGAKTMLSMFLNGRLQSGGVRWVLIMGDIAAKYLLPEELPVTDGKAVLSETTTAIVTSGLADMLADRENKRATWEAIRFLAERPA